MTQVGFVQRPQWKCYYLCRCTTEIKRDASSNELLDTVLYYLEQEYSHLQQRKQVTDPQTATHVAQLGKEVMATFCWWQDGTPVCKGVCNLK